MLDRKKDISLDKKMGGDIKVLVTGGTGLVGYALQKVVRQENRPGEEWIFISSKDADLRDIHQTRAIMEKHKPTHVLHLAAVVGGVFKNMKHNCDILSSNIRIDSNVYQVSEEMNVKKLVSCLSTCVFPDQITYPIRETMLHDGPPHTSNYGYCFAKRMLTAMNYCYRQQHGCNFISVIPTSVYGPNDNFCLEDAHVIPGLINKLYHCKRDKSPLVVMGTGRPLRQFIYSNDLAKLMVWAIRNYDGEEEIFLSVDEDNEISIRELVEIIVEEYDFKGEVIFDISKTDGQYKKTVSTAKMRKYLPDFKFTPIREGIRETIEWYEQNYHTARN